VHVVVPVVLPDVTAGGVGPSSSQLDYLSAIKNAARENCEEEVQRLHGLGVRSSVVTREGSPTLEILRLVKEERFELVVMGTHGRTGLRHLLVGSVAEAIVRRCPVPVLTVRERTQGEAPWAATTDESRGELPLDSGPASA
jgi:nucleotide-binding universal stress UspA family protein